jgi:hypothetical protein
VEGTLAAEEDGVHGAGTRAGAGSVPLPRAVIRRRLGRGES